MGLGFARVGWGPFRSLRLALPFGRANKRPVLRRLYILRRAVLQLCGACADLRGG